MAKKYSDQGLAVVTGASSGIGLELARCAAEAGYQLIIVADEATITDVAAELRREGASVEAVEADLSTAQGIANVVSAITASRRSVALLMANAGRGVGHAFLDQDAADIQKVIDTNIGGALLLVHHVSNLMRNNGTGRILLTGSIAGFAPGSYQAVYNASKAFINSFAFALREELRDHGVTVTCLMPGATDTKFFERADMLDTPIGKAPKDDPAFVAGVGFEALLAGEGDVVSGWKNKLMSAAANVTPSCILARVHRTVSEPDT